MVYRIYVEKKKDLAKEAADLLHEARELLQIRSLTGVRIINRYDVENIEKDLFDYAVKTVFSEPQLDTVSETIQAQGAVFAVEYLPGQFDQRADSASECIQLISQGERPDVRSAVVYYLEGNLTDADAITSTSVVWTAKGSTDASGNVTTTELSATLGGTKGNYVLTFQTDKASAFAIVSYETVSSGYYYGGSSTAGSGKKDSAKTADDSQMVVWLGSAVLAAAGVVILSRKKRAVK